MTTGRLVSRRADPAHANSGVPPSDDERLFDEGEAAQRLRISRRGLFTLRKNGEIAAVVIGRLVRYSRAELTRFIAAKTVKVTPVSRNEEAPR